LGRARWRLTRPPNMPRLRSGVHPGSASFQVGRGGRLRGVPKEARRPFNQLPLNRSREAGQSNRRREAASERCTCAGVPKETRERRAETCRPEPVVRGAGRLCLGDLAGGARGRRCVVAPPTVAGFSAPVDFVLTKVDWTLIVFTLIPFFQCWWLRADRGREIASPNYAGRVWRSGDRNRQAHQP
jgi:hypothetical protein